MYKKYFLKDLSKIFTSNSFDWIHNIKIQNVLSNLKEEYRFVGGCVRDALLGVATKDIDICTLLHPDEIEKRLNSYYLSVVGKRFGTIGVFLKEYQLEITTTREDIATYGRDADVNFVTSFEKDTCRRDFTFNALLCYKVNDEIIIEDYHNGIEDLLNKKVRFIGNIDERITEDYLRILRFIRFSARYSNAIDQDTLQIIKKHVSSMKILSLERVINEIILMCNKGNTLLALNCINDLSIPNLENTLYLKKYIDNTDISIASLFFSFENWKSISLPKTIKYVLKFKNLSKHANYFYCVADAWYKYKDTNVVNYINMWRECYNLPVYNIPCLQNYYYDCSNYTGIIRGKMEILARYAYLNNLDIESHINQLINNSDNYIENLISNL